MILGICGFCKRKFAKRRSVYKFCSLVCSNRFNLNGLREVSLPTYGVDLAEFVGICLGDGCVTKYQVSVTLNSIVDQDYVPYVLNLMKHLFPGVTVSVLPSSQQNTIDLRVNSRIVSSFMRKNGVISNAKTVPDWILKNTEYTRACIRGLFDTEGSISYKQYIHKKGVSIYKQLNFRNANMELMAFVRDNLIYLGLKPTTTLKRSLYLSNNRSLNIYRESIGFSNPKLLRRSLVETIKDYIVLVEAEVGEA
jgi:hypothetical protein